MSRTRTYMPFMDVARIVAVLAVVLIHAIAGDVSQGRVGWPWALANMVASAAVPVFVMMAGALNLAPAAHRSGVRDFLSRRASRILPALIVWSAFYLVVIQGWVMGTPLHVADVIDTLITGETFTHLYFLWAIAGLYLLSPVLAAFLHQGRQGARAWAVGLLACGWTAMVTATRTLTTADGAIERVLVEKGSLTYALLFLGYYVIGRAALIAPLSRRWAVSALAACLPLIAAMTMLKLRATQENPVAVQALLPSYTSPVLMAYSVLLFAAVASLTRFWRVGESAQTVLRRLGDATFGVFLVHFAVLIGVRELLGLHAPNFATLITVWALTSMLSFGFALVAAHVPGMRRIV